MTEFAEGKKIVKYQLADGSIKEMDETIHIAVWSWQAIDYAFGILRREVYHPVEFHRLGTLDFTIVGWDNWDVDHKRWYIHEFVQLDFEPFFITIAIRVGSGYKADGYTYYDLEFGWMGDFEFPWSNLPSDKWPNNDDHDHLDTPNHLISELQEKGVDISVIR